MVSIPVLICVLGVAVIAVAAARRLRRRRALRFGHAFPHPKDAGADPVGEAIGVLDRTAPIGPREPNATSIVWEAEQKLGIDPAKRPVYAYVGCLHPKLGRLGFIVGRRWFGSEAHGVTRCDTGGLAGRIEGFSHLDRVEADAALISLSHSAGEWDTHFFAELDTAFPDLRSYLRGDEPKPNCYPDARQKCIDGVLRAGGQPDRRLWTWEARCFSPIRVEEVDAFVLAPEAWKEFLHRFPGDIPPGIEVLIGSATPGGIDYFEEAQVLTAFERSES